MRCAGSPTLSGVHHTLGYISIPSPSDELESLNNAWGAATSLAVVQSHMPGASSSIPCLDILSPRPAPDPLLYTLLTVDAGRRRDALYIPSAAIRLLPLRLAVSEGAMKC